VRSYRPHIFLCLLLVAAAITLACGSSSPHIPQSVTVSPATADAQSYPGGQVPFTAIAYYNTMPSPVTNAAATWNECLQGGGPSEGVSISTSGVAQCMSGATGTYTIYAFVPDPTFRGECSGSSLPCGGTCGGVVGSAQLTCP
jgi:hypothetical protein